MAENKSLQKNVSLVKTTLDNYVFGHDDMKRAVMLGLLSSEPSLAKTFATESAEWIARQAIQIHGGYGVDFETGLERYLRDAVITTIYEGTNEIQRLTIVRELVRQAFGIR